MLCRLLPCNHHDMAYHSDQTRRGVRQPIPFRAAFPVDVSGRSTLDPRFDPSRFGESSIPVVPTQALVQEAWCFLYSLLIQFLVLQSVSFDKRLLFIH